ncbi:hypothetical protein CHARACLAT_017543, partial [Characodon lateralis]|nr:hypothetical protein [Characodon lateralis]
HHSSCCKTHPEHDASIPILHDGDWCSQDCEDDSLAHKKKVTIEDIYGADLRIHDPDAKWLSDKHLLYRSREGDVLRRDVDTLKEDIIVLNQLFDRSKAAKYQVSPDLKHVLFAFDVKPIYQYSYLAKYIIYSLVTQATWPLNPPEVHDAVLQYAGWGPQGQQLVSTVSLHD